MKTGKILHRFIAKDGKEVVLRTPRWEDLDDLLQYINSLTEEDLEVLPERKKMTRDEEADWLGRRLAEIEKNKVIDVVAEVDGILLFGSVAEEEVTKRSDSDIMVMVQSENPTFCREEPFLSRRMMAYNA